MKQRDYEEMTLKQFVAACVWLTEKHGLVPAFQSSPYFFHNCYIEGENITDAVERAETAGIYIIKVK